MFQRRSRRFRRRTNARSYMPRGNGDVHVRQRSNSFSNGQTRNNFKTTLSAEKLFEKYNTLAKEALSLGDKTLSENYLQHADHFMRIVEDKNRNQKENKDQVINKPIVNDKNLAENLAENRDVNQNKSIKEKKE